LKNLIYTKFLSSFENKKIIPEPPNHYKDFIDTNSLSSLSLKKISLEKD